MQNLIYPVSSIKNASKKDHAGFRARARGAAGAEERKWKATYICQIAAVYIVDK
jgi:hypothetical protein